MHILKSFTLSIITMISMCFLNFHANAKEFTVKDPENTLVMSLKNGDVYIELRPQWAPNHVKRLKKLTREGFYDNIVFHRVIAGFMAQTGDPTGTGTGGSKLPDLQAEFNRNQHIRGTVSMARAGNPHSANSQFFICLDQANFLNGKYTAFGQVIHGMEFIDMIKKGDPNNNGSVDMPDKIKSLKVYADLHKN